MNKKRKIVIALAKDEISRNDTLDALRCSVSVEHALCERDWKVEKIFIEKEDLKCRETIKEKIHTTQASCIFNLFEGFSDESHKEGEFAAILEEMEIPFTGNSSNTLGICLNKSLVKDLLMINHISVPEGIFIDDLQSLRLDGLQFPLFIKPNFEDASLGIDKHSFVTNKEDLLSALTQKLRDFPSGVVVEEFISGKEYNVGLIGNFPYKILGISVTDYSQYKSFSPFLSYSAKWDSNTPEFKKIVPVVNDPIAPGLRKRIIDSAIKAGEVLNCRNYFRVDLRQQGNELFVLDVNPNPDINQDSGFIKQAFYKGYTYGEIIEKIINFVNDPLDDRAGVC